MNGAQLQPLVRHVRRLVETQATKDFSDAQLLERFASRRYEVAFAALRQQVTAWEAANLPSKGVARVLRRVHQWLSQGHAAAAQDFWSQTAGGSHLP